MAVDRSKYYDYQNNYLKEHYKNIYLRLSINDDTDIIEFLEGKKADGVSVNALVKECIRQYMGKK